jgi:hypothetical protein
MCAVHFVVRNMYGGIHNLEMSMDLKLSISQVVH